jgi:hypothetical protein
MFLMFHLRSLHFGIDWPNVSAAFLLTFTFSQNIYDRYSRNERP